ncbi:MAG TPA: taurine catabolism dioxygenase TauD [Gammaproteobacteria bacterium]|nr:TauD/TfdA family dioxygenase [Gammaproteobacteria bacterium]HAY41021.1 taurine catabolism dioxygenase TauD [Gammaproteobacteria bacterium]|tara:strand:+ start:1691 stop:2608 length:918 start_codon:yes stop_codon:yes gene_type:complete
MKNNAQLKITNSPFLLDNDDIYRRWRDKKLTNYPTKIDELVIEVKDSKNISNKEYKALLNIAQKTNMTIYFGNTGTDPSPEIPLAVANRFGLGQINKNWLANGNGLTSLTVANKGVRKNYIPYTNRPINWHTDGYYNALFEQIRALNLHVVQKAAEGGSNQIMDHEIAYILLREKDPSYIYALMDHNVMMIPANIQENVVIRPERSGPVFSVGPEGNLHMRYTARTKNIGWSENPLVVEAIECLHKILNDTESKFVFKGLFEPGMGLISNNVLHDRSSFSDNKEKKRHYYRARYFDRLANTSYQI